MNELRFVRREERSLILANESDDEFRLVIDDLLISELKHASRKEREGSRVRPREIQSLVRAGKSRAAIAALTGLEEADIERYEEPVLAERRYILDRAHAVQVRTEASDESEQKFGEVIAERLVSLEADASEWTAWRDEETGWLVSLEFISRDVAHSALWSFDHRKQALAPINQDAVNLSKQGDVGDRLIPKLRAVDNGDRTSQFAPVADQEAPAATGAAQNPVAPVQRPEAQATSPAPATPALTAADAIPADAPDTADASATGAPTQQRPDARSTAPEVGRASAADVNAEYVRRRVIDQRAIKSDEAEPVDFSQTADLLDALRRRRGERQLAVTQDPEDTATTPIKPVAPAVPALPVAPAAAPERETPAAQEPAAPRALKQPRSIWGGAGVASGVTATPARDAGSGASAPLQQPPAAPKPAQSEPAAEPAEPPAGEDTTAAGDSRAPKKGRASIPSWDDILFGTRSDEDPAE